MDQLPAQSVRRESGTGCGLALTRQVVERLEGTIEVTRRVGEGSRFVVRLPERTRESRLAA